MVNHNVACVGMLPNDNGTPTHAFFSITGMDVIVETDAEALAEWQAIDLWDEFPDGIIPCPLGSNDIRENYTLVCVAVEMEGVNMTMWHQEQNAQKIYMDSRSLIRKRSRGGRSKKPLMFNSQKTRIKCQEEFVGFAVRWQGKQPTLALVMQPQLAAKFVGFLQARNISHGTVMKYCTQLSETVGFVMSNQWPGQQQWDAEHVEKVKDWFGNLRANCREDMRVAPPVDMPNITLWRAMVFANGQWDDFKKAFEVGWLLSLGGNANMLAMQTLAQALTPFISQPFTGKQLCVYKKHGHSVHEGRHGCVACGHRPACPEDWGTEGGHDQGVPWQGMCGGALQVSRDR